MKTKTVVRLAATLLLQLMLLPNLSLTAVADSTTYEETDVIDTSPQTPKNETAEADGETVSEPMRDALNLNCKSAVLMEANTGMVLYEQDPDRALPPASVTKVMTLLLVMEAIDSGKIKLDDMVSTSERAASMGGSQIYLKVGEQMSVEDMLKSVVIASANDAACALAEFVSGSEETFVKAMNDRAQELGMKNTTFENTNGLDDTATNHLTSAMDIAIMSRELIKHRKILEYSSIWMDTVRNGLFGLTNTNRLIRFYRGCTGLKTGSTSKAGFCISATAERDGMSLVCVIMGAETRDIRNAEAQKLLDWGFANYGVYEHTPEELEDLKLIGGKEDSIPIKYEMFSYVTDKTSASKTEYKIELPEYVSAPVESGERVGEVIFTCDGKEVGRVPITAAKTAERITFLEIWWRMLGKFLLK